MLANLKYLLCLRHLKFQECHSCDSYVTELPEYLGKLPQLSVLDIQDTSIKCLPSSITELSKLRLLLLPFGFILETLPYQLDESLVISVKDTHVRKTWKELRKEMEIFSSPTVTVDPSGYVILNGDPTPWIQENYNSHLMVRILDLKLENGVPVQNITNSIVKLTELTHLHITNGFFTPLPLQFTRITHLSLYDCEFDMESSLDSLGKLSALEFLHISLYDTELLGHMDLPVTLRQMTLCLDEDSGPLPDSMTKLSNLKALHLCGEGGEGIQFDSLPEILNLEKLKLVDCNIKSLPRGLRHVEILHTENICCREFDELGTCFDQLANVDTLSITCHCIKFLPSIAKLHNLQELQLKDCFSLKELPPNLDVMVNLCTLNLSGTGIKSLPCSISRLPKLKHLILPKCFQPGSTLLKFRNQSIVVTIDDTHDKYYENMGYFDFDHETSSEVDDHTTNTTEGVSKIVSKELEENINSQQQISPHQLLNQPDTTLILGDSHGSEANHAIGENSYHTFWSYQNQEILCFEREQLTADNRPLNVKNACFSSSQHSSQPEHMASLTSEIEHGLPPNLQHDSSSGTGNNLPVAEDGQNEYNVHREDYNFDGRDYNPVSHHSIHHLRNQKMPENITWVNEEVSKESEEVIIAEQQTSPQQLLNLPDALPDSNYNGSHSPDMDFVSPEIAYEIESRSSFQETVSFGRNSQRAVQNGQMDITYSETEHEIPFLNQDKSPCSERDVPHSENNLYPVENNQIENNSENEGQKGKRKRNAITLEEIQSHFGKKEKEAAKNLGVSLSTMKRRCRELGMEEWPSSRHQSSNSEHSQFNMVDVIDNSASNATKSIKESTVATQSHTNELATERMNGTHLCTSSTTVQPNESSSTFAVKAKWNEDIARFDFSLSSNIDKLKEEIGNRLELEAGKFKIKYQDDDGDWVLVTYISDLENALRLSKSAGSDVVRLSVISKT